MAASVVRDAAWLFESLGLSDEPENKRPKITIPDTLIFKRDESSRRLGLTSWLSNGKAGTVVRKLSPEFVSQVRRWRDKLVAGVPAGQQQAVAQAFGFDGVGQGVPPAGLDNLLADLESGALEGITMLQAKVKLGPKPAGHFEVEVANDATGKLAYKARIAQSEIITPAAGAALRSLRDDLLGVAKRIITAVEAGRKVRLQSAVLEFVGDSSAQVGLHLVGAFSIQSSVAPGEPAPANIGLPFTAQVAMLTGGSGLPEANSTALPSPSAAARTLTGGEIETVYIDAGTTGTLRSDGMGPSTFMASPYGVDANGNPMQPMGMDPASLGHMAALGMAPGTMPVYPGVVGYNFNFAGNMQLASPMDAGGPMFPASISSAVKAPASSPGRNRSNSPPSRQKGKGQGQQQSLASPTPTQPPAGMGAAMWADRVGAGSPGGNASVAAAEVVSALKKQVQELQAQLQAARLAAYAPPKTSAMVIKGEPKEVAELRSAGRFEFKDEPLPPADAPKEALEEVVRRLQLRWREALDLATTVQTAYGREASEAVSRLVEAHRRELSDIKAAFEAMEDNVATTNARLNAASLELAAASRREQAAMDRANRLMGENRRLSAELQQTQASAQRASPTGQPSPNLPPGLPRRPSFSQRGSNVSRAGAEILGLGMPSPAGGMDDAPSFNYGGDNGGTALASTQAALLTLQAQVRQLQLELDTTRDNLASESASRQELSNANAKLLEEFRLERKRLKAQVTQLEEAEKARVATLFTTHGGRGGPGGASAAAVPSAPSADVSALLAKVSEAEELQSQLAVARAELAEARQATASAATGRVEAMRQLEALAPVRAALEAEAAALRHEVSALRGRSSSSSGSSSPTGTSTAEASSSSDRAAAARAVADANLARTELRNIREQLDRVRGDATKYQEQIAALRATRTMEVESVRQAERAERDRVIRELSANHDSALRSALAAVQDEANKRFSAATSRLQDEVMTLSSKLQAAAGEAAQLKVKLKSAEITQTGEAARDSSETAAVRASLDVAQSQVKALAAELNVMREAAAKQAFEISSQANAQFAALQAQHSQALDHVKRDAESVWTNKMKAALAEAAAAASKELASAKAAAASRYERLALQSEEDRAALIAGDEKRLKTVLASVEAEVQTRLATAVSEALTSARSDWEKAAAAAVEAMRDGGAKTAQQMAESASAAARREVQAQLGAQLQQLEQALAVEKQHVMHLQQSLAAKDQAVQSLLTDIRVQAQQGQEAQARAVAAAEAAATESAQRQVSLRLSEAEATWIKDKESAVRSAVEKAKAEPLPCSEAERQAFRKASEQAAEAMLQEADALVTSARAEALRDKEAALAGLRAELTSAYEATATHASRDIANIVQQRDAAMQAVEARHAAAMVEATKMVQSLQESLAKAQALRQG